MTPAEADALFAPFYDRFVNLAVLTSTERPLHMAHYTTLNTLEKIITSNELWFSNPLFMNDLQEMRWGVQKGQSVFVDVANEPDIIATVGSDARMSFINHAFLSYFRNFDLKYAFDVYVFCLSEHDPVKHPDGLLSMWRGYGANGHGAALVFNTSFITVAQDSPLLIAKVHYATEAEREAWLKDIFRRCFGILRQNHVPDTDLHIIGYHMLWHVSFVPVHADVDGWRGRHSFKLAVIFSV
jgi:hypothetical protein